MATIRILYLASNPLNTGRLALDEEIREIQAKIRAAKYGKSVQVCSRWAVQPDDLLTALNEVRPHIMHFTGHGSPDDEIILQDENGAPQPVSKAALVNLFRAVKDNIRTVVLSACYSEPQARAITEQVDCAIGMTRAVTQYAAIRFAAAFYGAIGFGRSLREAFDQGIASLMLEGIAESNYPELLVRSGADPAQIWLLQGRKSALRAGGTLCDVEMELGGPIEEFNGANLMASLERVLGAEIKKLRLTSIRRGSTIVRIEGPFGTIAKLVRAIRSDRPALEELIANLGLLSIAWEDEGKRCEVRIAALSAVQPKEVKPNPSKLLLEEIKALEAIRPGMRAAGRYRDLVARVLETVFESHLSNFVLEQSIGEGLQRVDIVAQNTAREGFFHDVVVMHRVPCAYVFFECKNYANDIANPDIDQLAGRLSDVSGKLGFLVCRNIRDKHKLLRRRKGILHSGLGVILVLDDDSLEALIRLRAANDRDGLNRHLSGMLRDLLM